MSDTKTTINEDFQEIFKKHLPETLAGALKVRFEELERKELQLETLEPALKKAQEDLKELDGLKKHKEAVEQSCKQLSEDLKQFELEKAEFERDKKVFELETKLAAEIDKTKHVVDLNMGLVRNTMYRSNLYNSKTEDKQDEHGYIKSDTATENITSSNTEE